jgi:hypothetical protein
VLVPIAATESAEYGATPHHPSVVAFVGGDLRAGRLPFQRSSTPFSIQRLIAADRVIPRSAAHASTRRTRSRGSLIASTGSRPVAGRPRFFGNTFLLDCAIFLVIPIRRSLMA